MQSPQDFIPIQLNNKKEALLLKRLKAKQRTANQSLIVIQNKQDIRKQRNRHAAQKSRDRKKSFLQNLQFQNERLKQIIGKCQICSAEERLTHPQENDPLQAIQQEEAIVAAQSPSTFINETFIREQNFNQDSSTSNLSKYFWFGCFFILLCMVNYQNIDTNQTRVLFQKTNSNIQKIPLKFGINQTKNTLLSSTIKNKNNSLMSKQQVGYCQKCMECLKNITNQTSGGLQLFFTNHTSNQTNNTNTTNKVLFCKSRAKFFNTIYEALRERSLKQGNKSRQITTMLIKGKLLSDLLQQNCFSGQQINQEDEYIINFTVAILQMTPVKMSRASRLSTHSD